MTLLTLASPPVRVTPDDLLTLEDEGLFELVDGKLIEKNMSSVASETAGLVIGSLYVYAGARKLGKIYPEQSFRCFPGDPDKVRRPDIAFIVAERAAGVSPEGHVTIAPDIAIEVVSPSDKIYELDEKLVDYRSAGVKLVWVVNPNSRTIRVHRPDHTVTELSENDTLSGESVLSGYSVMVRDVLPAAAAKPAT